VTERRRLRPAARRDTLLDAGAALFASHRYDAVLMDDIARTAGVSRAMLYRHFATKRDLFEAIYQRAADRLLTETQGSPDATLAEQVAAGLDAHIDYFLANRNTVLAANRVLAGDPGIQAIISSELHVLRERMLAIANVPDERRNIVSAVLMSWLVFVRSLCVDWLERPSCSRVELRDICTGALLGALQPLTAATQETNS
jgi:AcrR family transcriptional regulator